MEHGARPPWEPPISKHNLFWGRRHSFWLFCLRRVFSIAFPLLFSIWIGVVVYLVNIIQILHEEKEPKYLAGQCYEKPPVTDYPKQVEALEELYGRPLKFLLFENPSLGLENSKCVDSVFSENVDKLTAYHLDLIEKSYRNFDEPLYQPSFLLGVSTFILTLAFTFFISFDLDKLSSSAPGAFRRFLFIYLIMIGGVLILGHVAVISQDLGANDYANFLMFLMVPVTILIQVFSDRYVAFIYRKYEFRFPNSATYYSFISWASLAMGALGFLFASLYFQGLLEKVLIFSDQMFYGELILAGLETALILSTRTLTDPGYED